LKPSSDSGQAPLVSVCIANYNGMEVIDDCLRSVLGK
jgi:glycosyltransferase involved in cell wall biosynthesis